MNSKASSDRRSAILSAAMQTIGAYGYRRTSMEQIAHACGLSRPALYQMFAGKAALYRALVEDMTSQALIEAEEALSGGEALEERFSNMLLACVVRPMRLLAALPHGAELLSIKQDVAGDLLSQWDDDIVDRIAGTLMERENLAPDQAHDIAISIMLQVDGLKAREPNIEALAAGCERIARVAAAAST